MDIDKFIKEIENAKENGAKTIYFMSSSCGEEYDYSIHKDKDDIEDSDGRLVFYIYD